MEKKEIKFMQGDKEANCGTCENSDCGVCDYAGEVGSDWVCNLYQKREL